MNEINLQDETLNINATASYALSMQAGLDGFSYCILDSTRNKFIAIRHIPFSFEDFNSDVFSDKIISIIDTDEYLCCKYKSVRFVFNTTMYTLVPEPIFDKEQMKLFLSFNHELNDSEVLHSNSIRNAEAYIVFSLLYSLVEAVYMRFPNSKLYHSSVPFIESNLNRFKLKGNKAKVIANVNSIYFDIIVLNSSGMQLYNSFYYKNADDLVYYIMYIYDQLKLNPEEADILLSGILTKNSEAYLKLKRFVRNIIFDKLNEQFQYSYIFNDVPSGMFTNIVNLHKCE